MAIAGSGYTRWGGGYDGPGIDPSGVPPVMWWVGSDDPNAYGYPWGVQTGPGHAVVTRATSLICGPLSAAPYRVLDQTTIGAPAPAPRWLVDPMLMRPDARFADDVYPEVLKLPRSEFWASWVRGALWYGVSGFICQEDESGSPQAGTLRLVDPLTLYTERADDGSLRWAIGDGSGEPAVFSRDGYLQLGLVRYRLITLRNPLSPVDSEGMSIGVFAMNPTTFHLAGQIDRYASGVFRSGIPAGFLQVETPGLTQEQAENLKSNWMRHHGGDRRSIAVLNSTTRFQALSLSPLDAALDATTKLNLGQVAYAFGLDPLTLGVSMGNSMTYATTREAWLNHRDFGLSPWISAVQDVLSSLLAGTAGVVVNLDGFANPPLSERVATGAAAVKAGLIEVDEWRQMEGLPPLPKKPEPQVPPQLQVVPGEDEQEEPEEIESQQQRARPPALRR
jgi:hypothetical protein